MAHMLNKNLIVDLSLLNHIKYPEFFGVENIKKSG